MIIIFFFKFFLLFWISNGTHIFYIIIGNNYIRDFKGRCNFRESYQVTFTAALNNRYSVSVNIDT